jgi:hypothetical protein
MAVVRSSKEKNNKKLSCPLCRKTTPIKKGVESLPKNFFITNILEKIKQPDANNPSLTEQKKSTLQTPVQPFLPAQSQHHVQPQSSSSSPSMQIDQDNDDDCCLKKKHMLQQQLQQNKDVPMEDPTTTLTTVAAATAVTQEASVIQRTSEISNSSALPPYSLPSSYSYPQASNAMSSPMMNESQVSPWATNNNAWPTSTPPTYVQPPQYAYQPNNYYSYPPYHPQSQAGYSQALPPASYMYPPASVPAAAPPIYAPAPVPSVPSVSITTGNSSYNIPLGSNVTINLSPNEPPKIYTNPTPPYNYSQPTYHSYYNPSNPPY